MGWHGAQTCGNSIWLLVSDGVRGDVEKNIFLSTGGDGDVQTNKPTENEGMFPLKKGFQGTVKKEKRPLPTINFLGDTCMFIFRGSYTASPIFRWVPLPIESWQDVDESNEIRNLSHKEPRNHGIVFFQLKLSIGDGEVGMFFVLKISRFMRCMRIK